MFVLTRSWCDNFIWSRNLHIYFIYCLLFWLSIYNRAFFLHWLLPFQLHSTVVIDSWLKCASQKELESKTYFVSIRTLFVSKLLSFATFIDSVKIRVDFKGVLNFFQHLLCFIKSAQRSGPRCWHNPPPHTHTHTHDANTHLT